MKQIDLHSDDYALSIQTSKDIIACLNVGVLDSISVLTNMSCFDFCIRQYKKELSIWPKEPLLSLHLNLVEGHCVATPSLVPHLVDQNGYFSLSWGQLFLLSYTPWKYHSIKQEIKIEIEAQTLRFRKAFGMQFGQDRPLRFDGHQHTQMIPIVYSSLLEMISEKNLNVDYIRVTKEPFVPFFKKVSLWPTYRPINWIKHILLNALSLRMEQKIFHRFPNWKNANPRMYLWGVLMSGKMDEERVKLLFPSMLQHARHKNRILEIFFHPGTLLASEVSQEFCKPDANSFYLSSNRQVEFETLMKFAKQNQFDSSH